MGSTRGFFIGQLIDDLASISQQVENRCRLGYTDLNRMLEDFFRDALNVILGTDLANLNQERSNEPSLDLGDPAACVAFQITSRANAAKVNGTLQRVTPAQAAAYNKIYILVVGEKQGSYALDDSLAANFGFTADDIWDVNDLCRKAVSLPILKLQELHALVAAEVAKVKVELELPRADGSYPTSLDDYIEQAPKPTRSDASAFFEHEATQGILSSLTDARANLDALADALAKLPRISREFYALLVQHSEWRSNGLSGKHTNADLIARLSRYPDTEGELRFLADRGLIRFDAPEEHGVSPYWRIFLPSGLSDIEDALHSFIEAKGLNVRRVLVNLDFTPFGPPPT